MPNSTPRNVSRDPWLACLLCIGLAACGKANDGSDADAGSALQPGAAGTGTSGTGAGVGDDGKGTGIGNTHADGGVADAGDVDSDNSGPEYEGIPTSDKIPYGSAPANCTTAGTNTADTLVLQLDAKISTLLLSSKDGVLQVNGVSCTGVASPKNVKITGSASVDTVVVDFSLGAFPESMSNGTISIDTSGGKDVVAIAGTADADDIHLGSMTAGSALVHVGDMLPKLQISNQETLLISSGPGDDRIDATGGASLGGPLAVALTGYGGAGSDVLVGGSAADELHGGSGDDTFNTATSADGADFYDGGPGEDTLSYELRTTSVHVSVDNTANDGATGERDNVQTTIEILIGGSADDTLTGSAANDTLIGGPGNDTLNGGDGDDTFVESTMAQGADIMNGGAGSDTVDYSERTADMSVTLCISAVASCEAGACGCGADDGESHEGDTLVNVENVTTGSGNDKLMGSAADNTLLSGAGNDVLQGLAGDDTLYAGLGDDMLSGGDGDDLLSGDGGRDTLDGGDGQGDICIDFGVIAPINCELF
jgi:Ca2+-binding RTX toxin-like protein